MRLRLLALVAAAACAWAAWMAQNDPSFLVRTSTTLGNGLQRAKLTLVTSLEQVDMDAHVLAARTAFASTKLSVVKYIEQVDVSSHVLAARVALGPAIEHTQVAAQMAAAAARGAAARSQEAFGASSSMLAAKVVAATPKERFALFFVGVLTVLLVLMAAMSLVRGLGRAVCRRRGVSELCVDADGIAELSELCESSEAASAVVSAGEEAVLPQESATSQQPVLEERFVQAIDKLPAHRRNRAESPRPPTVAASGVSHSTAQFDVAASECSVTGAAEPEQLAPRRRSRADSPKAREVTAAAVTVLSSSEEELLRILNSGDEEELLGVKHIGSKVASKILEWTQTNGDLQDPRDLCTKIGIPAGTVTKVMRSLPRAPAAQSFAAPFGA